MALQQTIATGLVDENGNAMPATYWEWAQINVQQLPTQTCSITLLGYASSAAFAAAPAAPLSTMQFNFPAPLTGDPTIDAILSQFPFDPTYLAAHFSSYGIGASQASAQHWVMADPRMSGATVVS